MSPQKVKRRDRLTCSPLIESLQLIRQPIENTYGVFILSIPSLEKTRSAISV